MDKQYFGYELVNGVAKGKIEIQYYMLKHVKNYEELDESRLTYGVEIVKKEYYDSGGVLVEHEKIEDVTTDFQNASNILEVLKRNQVMPTHLNDIMENLI